MQHIKFQNQDCILVENKKIQVIISQTIGPRILGFNFHGANNLLAELPDCKTSLPDGSEYHFFGGHRFWIAPENIPLTYNHDDRPVEIRSLQDTVIIKKKLELPSEIEKTVRIKLNPESAKVEIEHILKNFGRRPFEGAAWAITQLKPGGIAMLPQSKLKSGLLPNRSLVLWPYTDITCPQVRCGNDCILVETEMDSPFKIGFPNPRGWLAYWLDRFLFVKHAQYFERLEYYDMGSSSEFYCKDQFLELETLGPKTILEPGESLSHFETWELFEDVDRPENEGDVAGLVEKLGLDNWKAL